VVSTHGKKQGGTILESLQTRETEKEQAGGKKVTEKNPNFYPMDPRGIKKRNQVNFYSLNIRKESI